jgi:ABC-type branched-subunit amino acid transport system substrate-binding protein
MDRVSGDPSGAAETVRPVTVDKLGVRLALVALLCLALACAGVGGPDRKASDEERTNYAAALEEARRDPAAGATRLEAFIDSYPQSALADDAAEELALLALEQGDGALARSWFTLIVREYPNEDRAEMARLGLARMAVEAGEPETARRVLMRARFSQFDPAERRAAYRLLGELSEERVERLVWLARERAALFEELQLLREELQLPSPQPRPVVDEQPQPLVNDELQAPSEELREPYGDADATQLALLESELTQLDAELDELSAQLPDEELELVARTLDQENEAARLWLHLARRALAEGEIDEARKLANRVSDRTLSRGDEVLLGDLLLLIQLRAQMGDAVELPTFAEVAAHAPPSTEGASGTLGLILPLSGRFASYGEESLRGALLAARIFDIPVDLPEAGAPAAPAWVARSENDEAQDTASGADDRDAQIAAGADEPGGLRLVVRDSRGSPEVAVAAVRELGEIEDLVAIVGPLLGTAAEAAAQAAEEIAVPMLALTSREEVARGRDGVFRLRTTPDDEVHFLVGHAAGKLGARRFAVLYPKDSYGRGMRDRFWEAVEAQGGAVVASSGYEPDATDFGEAIRRMIGYTLLTPGEREALEQREALLRRGRRLEPADAAVARRVAYATIGPEGEPLPPIIDFDVLFIPDSHDKVVLIAPQLSFHHVVDVRLLGPNGWNHPELVPIGREHVSGAVISALFHEESRFPIVAIFVDDYAATLGQPPGVFAAHSYDAVNLVLVQLARGRDTRAQVRDGILRTQGYPGSSGVTSMMPDGNARKRPFLLGVRGGRIIPLD